MDPARTILLVESNPTKREQLLGLCRSSSPQAQVEICTSPREAVSRLSQQPYSACLLPNDLDLLNEARRTAENTLFLLISDDGNAERDAGAIAEGADDVLARETLSSEGLQRALINAERRRDSGRKLQEMARQDPLTGLGNRACWKQNWTA
ncbi:hypothetical protein UMZ34_04440 [Halopseudomonas pachastrellae]|nr:hypothetical protein UMZ34_04440 [Halopseudomonas pachastrellae]